MNINQVISLFGGLALFLFGMRVMGDGLQRAAGPKLKNILSLMTRNRLIAMLTGLCVTAVIQSSGATTVMVVGFVNAQMLTLAQAVGVIIGANIGTTVTSLLLSIKFDPGAVFAFAGILMVMIFEKREVVKQTGFVFLGLGVLFTGMNLMKAAMAPLRDWPVFQDLMRGVRNPLLGVLIGMAVTALLQSSSVSIGIMQVMAEAGLLSMEGALFLVLGAQIGACTPTLLAMANTNRSAKRAAMVQLIFNLLKTAIILVLSCFLPLSQWYEALVPGNPKLCISCMHITFNIAAAILLLPCGDLLMKIAYLLIPGEDPSAEAMKMLYYDKRLLKTPSFAAEQLHKEACRMGREAHAHICMAAEALRTGELSKEQEINYHEELSDYLEEAITEGLVAVMPLELSEHESRHIAGLFHVVTDMERISDHAMNLFDLARERSIRNAKLSDKATEELEELFGRVMRVLDSALVGLEEGGMSPSIMALLEAEEQKVDDLTDALRKKHIERLKEHKCAPKSGVIFLEAINNMERVADHAMNIAAIAQENISTHIHPHPAESGMLPEGGH